MNFFYNNKQIWGEILKAEVMKRGEKGGVLVVRPDSGDPPEVVVKVSVTKQLKHNLPQIRILSVFSTEVSILIEDRLLHTYCSEAN